MSNAVEEFFDLLKNRFLIADKWQVIIARQLDVFRPGNLPGHVAGPAYVRVQVSSAMNNESRHANRRHDVCDIDLRVHFGKGQGRAGTGAAA